MAARVWASRHAAELEAAQRFRDIGAELRAVGASDGIVDMAGEAAADEVRHAEHCRALAEHFDRPVVMRVPKRVRSVAPSHLNRRERVLYDVVALSCITETLSTAVLGALVERAHDSLARRLMQSILRDEVPHSRLGWAFLAEEGTSAAHAAISETLPKILNATLGDDLFAANIRGSEELEELSGLGALPRAERQQIAMETFEAVVFPGLERFGVDAAVGRRWLGERSTQLSRAV